MRLSTLFLKTFMTMLFQLTPLWGILAIIISVSGIYVGMIEGLGWWEGLYFGWITGLTIGYGDIVPTKPLARLLCVIIGLIGIVNTGIIVSIAVTAGRGVYQHLGLNEDIAQKLRDTLEKNNS